MAEKKTKKKPTKKTKSTVLKNAPAKHYFHLNGERTVKSLFELAEALESSDEYVFNHHVSQDRNDFANWARDIFKDESLGKELENSHGKENARMTIYRHLARHATK